MPSAFGGLGWNPRDKSSKSIVNNLRSNSAKRNFVDPFGVAQIRLRRRRQVDRRTRCARREAVGSGERSELRSSRKAPREELSRSESRKSPSAFPWRPW